MKKVFLALAVVAGVAFVSCNSKQAEAVDSDSVAADTMVVVEEATNDSDTVVAAAEEVVEAPAETPAN